MTLGEFRFPRRKPSSGTLLPCSEFVLKLAFPQASNKGQQTKWMGIKLTSWKQVQLGTRSEAIRLLPLTLAVQCL